LEPDVDHDDGSAQLKFVGCEPCAACSGKGGGIGRRENRWIGKSRRRRRRRRRRQRRSRRRKRRKSARKAAADPREACAAGFAAAADAPRPGGREAVGACALPPRGRAASLHLHLCHLQLSLRAARVRGAGGARHDRLPVRGKETGGRVRGGEKQGERDRLPVRQRQRQRFVVIALFVIC